MYEKKTETMCTQAANTSQEDFRKLFKQIKMKGKDIPFRKQKKAVID